MKKLLLLITLVAGVIAFALPAQATTLTINLNFEFSGPEAGVTPPASLTTPWLIAIFDDSYGTNDQVKLTMQTPNLTGSEFVEQWLFNFNPVDNSGLSFTQFNTTDFTSIASRRLVEGDTAFKPDGDGFFDIKFEFPTSGNTFTTPKELVYIIEYNANITVNDFDVGSVGGDKGSLHSAAHIQSIFLPGGAQDNTEGSGWIAGIGGITGQNGVPEPATMLLLGSGFMGLALFGGKKRFKRRNG